LQAAQKSYTIWIEKQRMLITPDLMRVMLLVGMLAMAIMAAFYLRQRKLSILAYAAWGLVAILIPIAGPFFVIWIKPGGKRLQIKP
jgi:hypothetical protein